MGVKFVTPKSGDTVAVVARSVEAKVVEEATDDEVEAPVEESPTVDDGATIDGQDAPEASVAELDETPDEDTEE
jgi:DNA gyrase subunit A